MERGLDLGAIEALTFDCYGTLIDWLGGIRAAVAQMPSLQRCDVDRLLRDRAEIEAEIQAGDWLPYDDVLERSMLTAAARQDREPSASELTAFAASMATWPPCPDSPAALQRLAQRYRLAILSNVQTQTLRASVALLGVPFELLVTAEEIRSYKPARKHFHVGLERLGLSRDKVFHVAQSLYHDIGPATELGWRTAWVNRLAEPLPPGVRPDLVTTDLAELADVLGG